MEALRTQASHLLGPSYPPCLQNGLQLLRLPRGWRLILLRCRGMYLIPLGELGVRLSVQVVILSLDGLLPGRCQGMEVALSQLLKFPKSFSLSVAVINTVTKNNLGREGLYLSTCFRSRYVTEGRWRRHSCRNCSRNPGGTLLTDLLTGSCSTSFLIQPKCICLGNLC